MRMGKLGQNTPHEQLAPSYLQLILSEHAAPSGTPARVAAHDAGFGGTVGTAPGHLAAPPKVIGDAQRPPEHTRMVLHAAL
jgi:hypothetical protein